ncbi:unnamed protein product [Phaedon cochleariae]|uniref:Cytochrome P450 n=1 Tax=Phaedon cochleariae TaxID=80249 RepID=A0A9P0DWZ8_PHACE|nr:unnamed protein product [Phaedon cochleariae]
MILYLIVISVVVAYIFHYLLSPLNYWRKQGVIQRNTWDAFIFNWFVLLKRQNVVHFIENMYKEFPSERYSGCYQFNSPALVLRDPDLIKEITIKKFDHFTDRRTYIPDDVDPLWGKNLFSLRGAHWRNMRSTLSPAFTSSKMKGIFILMENCAENFVNHFMADDKQLIVLETKDTFTRFCNDVIATTAFGVEVDSLKYPDNEFYAMGKRATNFTSLKSMMKFLGYLVAPKLYRALKIKFFDDNVSNFFRTLIDETIALREEQNVSRPDIIQLLMEARNGVIRNEEDDKLDTGYATVEESIGGKIPMNITNEDITAQALVFFFAGFESLSTLMCFTAYELAMNPDIQDKLRNEIRETSEKCKGKLTYDALVSMKYLDMVISEVLRKWPSQAGAERICTKTCTIDPKTPEQPPLRLAEGDLLLIPTYGIHRDPKFYPNPDKFDPERFSEENKGRIQPYSYQPFGLGPRNCIGSRFALLEVKILFFYVLSRFEFVAVERTAIPLVLDKRALILAAEGGMWLGLKRLRSS